MADKLQEIFNECLERVNRGESIESCLRNYPEQAADLQILLGTVANIRWRASGIYPDPAFKARARAQFIAAQYRAQQDSIQQAQPSQAPGLFSLHQALVPTLGAVMLLLVSTFGSAAAATNAMPDEILYPVKIATEQVQMVLTFADDDKVELNTLLAEKRSQEIVAMSTQGKAEYLPAVTQNMISHLEQASVAIARVEATEMASAATAIKPIPAAPAKLPPAASAPATVPPPQPSQAVPATPATVPPPQPSQAVPATPATVPPPQPSQAVPATPATVPPPQPSQAVPAAPATVPPPQPSQAVPAAPATVPDKSGSVSQASTPETTTKASTRTSRLKQSLDTAASRNLETLLRAYDKAPEQAKDALQKAIDAARSRLQQIKQEESKSLKSSQPAGTTNRPSTDNRKIDDDDNDQDNKPVPSPIKPPTLSPNPAPVVPKPPTSSSPGSTTSGTSNTVR